MYLPHIKCVFVTWNYSRTNTIPGFIMLVAVIHKASSDPDEIVAPRLDDDT